MSETTRSDDRTAVLSGPAEHDAQPAGRSRAGGGTAAGALAVAALAVGVLACSFSWMFFIGTYIVVAGLVALLLGVAGALVARRAAHSPLLAVAGAVLGVLSIVAVVTTEAVVKSAMSDLFGGLGSPGASADPFPADSSSPTESALPTDSAFPTSEPSAAPSVAPDGDVVSGNSDAPLPVGTSGEVGEYTVTVTAVDADVALTVDLAAAGAPEPTNGRYVLVDLSATYNGADTGDVHTDLLTGLAAWEGPEFYSDDCPEQLSDASTSVPALAPGESASWLTCLDVLPGALEGGTLFVSELTAGAEIRTYWQLG